MKISGNAVFHLFYYKNTTYSSRRATKIGMHMSCDTFSAQIKNYADQKNLRYPKFEKKRFLAIF